MLVHSRRCLVDKEDLEGTVSCPLHPSMYLRIAYIVLFLLYIQNLSFTSSTIGLFHMIPCLVYCAVHIRAILSGVPFDPNYIVKTCYIYMQSYLVKLSTKFLVECSSQLLTTCK